MFGKKGKPIKMADRKKLDNSAPSNKPSAKSDVKFAKNPGGTRGNKNTAR